MSDIRLVNKRSRAKPQAPDASVAKQGADEKQKKETQGEKPAAADRRLREERESEDGGSAEIVVERPIPLCPNCLHPLAAEVGGYAEEAAEAAREPRDGDGKTKLGVGRKKTATT